MAVMELPSQGDSENQREIPGPYLAPCPERSRCWSALGADGDGPGGRLNLAARTSRHLLWALGEQGSRGRSVGSALHGPEGGSDGLRHPRQPH